MTKIITAAPAAPAEAMVDIRPDTIVITELGFKAWPTVSWLIRLGWTIDENMPPFVTPSTGYASITLVRSKSIATVDIMGAEIAQKAEELATSRHAVAYLRDVQAAAVMVVENAKKAEAAAMLAAEIESQRQTLAALEKAAAKAAA